MILTKKTDINGGNEKQKKEKKVRALFFGKILKYNVNRYMLKSIVFAMRHENQRHVKTGLL